MTKVARLEGFYPAEAYHQDYAVHNPDNPYIVFNDIPKSGRSWPSTRRWSSPALPPPFCASARSLGARAGLWAKGLLACPRKGLPIATARRPDFSL